MAQGRVPGSDSESDSTARARGGDAQPRNDAQPPVTRILKAGARGAELAARATGVDRAVNEAVEEAIVRALRSPTVIHAIERAIESDVTQDWTSEEVAQLVRRILESEAAGDAWNEVLESDQVQMLVERIAGAPEIRAAITAQGAGLITDIGVRLTVITERLDDSLERVVRPRDADSETDQAGLATRAVAGAIDLTLLFAAYSVVAGVLASVTSSILGHSVSTLAIAILWVLGVIAGGAIFAAFWALAGQTPGMRFLSIRLIVRGSRHVPFGRAVRRVPAVILSLLPLGLGYLAILRDRERRAWADRWTGTVVVYDLGARSAPHSKPPQTGVPRPASATDSESRRAPGALAE